MRTILKYSDGKAIVQVVELEPQCRTFKIAHCEECAREKKYHTYYLSLPYMQFYRYFGKRNVFSVSFNDKSFEIEKIGDSALIDSYLQAYTPPFPNCGDTVCMPKGAERFGMKRLIESFFNSIFCEREYHEDDEDYSDIHLTKLKSYFNWERETKKDPSFIMDKNWWAGDSGNSCDCIRFFVTLHLPFGKYLKEQYQ